MPTITDEHGEVITIPHPEEKLQYYLQTLGIQESELDFLAARKMFLRMIADFRTGTLSLDELSALASALWLPPGDTDTEEVSEFKEAIDSAAELNFYVRRIREIETEPKGATFIAMMLKVMEFYEKYK